MRVQHLVERIQAFKEDINTHIRVVTSPSSKSFFSSQDLSEHVHDLANIVKAFDDIYHNLRQLLLGEQGIYRTFSVKDQAVILNEGIKTYRIQRGNTLILIDDWDRKASSRDLDCLERRVEDSLEGKSSKWHILLDLLTKI